MEHFGQNNTFSSEPSSAPVQSEAHFFLYGNYLNIIFQQYILFAGL